MLFIILSCFLLNILNTNGSLDKMPISKLDVYYPDYNLYHNFSKIYYTINKFVQNNSPYFQLDKSFKSRLGYSQFLLHITNFTENTNLRASARQKVKVLLTYGEHAREFFPVESLFYFLTNISQGLLAPKDSYEERFSHLILTNVDLYIVPVLNPDGRIHIEKTFNYCWRGTSTGVDINRNFNWNYKKSSEYDSNEGSSGPYVFSEPEGKILIQLTNKYHFDAFISFHSGIREIYLPFADSKSKLYPRQPYNFAQMLKLAEILASSSQMFFRFGQASTILPYPADGTIFDFMSGIKRIPFSFAIELWGEGDISNKKCFTVFNPPSPSLEDCVKSVHPLYVNLLTYLINWKQQNLEESINIENNKSSLTFIFVLPLVIVLLGLFTLFNRRIQKSLRLYPRQRIVSLKSLSSSLHSN